MYVATARSAIRSYARNAFDSSQYADSDIDFALQTAADEIIRRTRCIMQIDTMTVASGATALVSVPTSFRPDRFIAAYLTGANVKVTWSGAYDHGYYGVYYTEGAPAYSGTIFNNSAILDAEDYLQLYNRSIGEHFSAQPNKIAFDSWQVGSATTGMVYPIPNDAFTIKMRWTPFFTSWTSGLVFTPVAQAVIAGGAVTNVNVISPGGSFSIAPTVTITGGGGTSAAATAVLDSVHSTGGVTSYTVTNGGSGYTTVPTVSFTVGSADLALNIPDDLIRPILMYCVPSLLQYNVPEQAFASAAFQRGEAFVKSIMGSGSLGARQTVARRRY